MAIKEARVPDIGDYTDVPVIEVLVAVGDTVKADQGLVTLESDKATMEVPAPFAGVVKELKVKLGDTVSEGSVVAMIEVAASGRDAKAAPAPAAPPAASAAPARREAAGAAPAAPVSPLHRAGSDAPPRPLRPRAPAAATASPPVRVRRRQVLPDKVPHASPARAPVRARTGRRPGARSRAASARAASARKTCRVREGARWLAACRAARGGCGRWRRAQPAAVAEGRLRQVRRDRSQAAVADQEDLRRQPRAQLGDDSARHPARRGRHHRDGGLPQEARRGEQGPSSSPRWCS